jgi:DivIVA domain-containing protein
MVDESFHLTPLDARRYDFGSALRGYDKTRVDQFRDQVAEELERLARLHQEMEAKAKSFHEQLRAFRDRDKALNEALVSAQQLRGEIRDQAEREGQLLVREARAEAERLLDEARAEIRRLQAQVDDLERMRHAHVAQLRALASRQLTEIDAAEHAMAPAADKGGDPTGARKADKSGAKSKKADAQSNAPREASGDSAGDARAAASSDTPGDAARPMTPNWLDASVPE